jgi:uncharacterized protein (DUF885 family)/uncharacterized membrane protein YdbT with pleckstrin-like domain
VSWWFTRFGFDGDALRIDSGVLNKRSRRVRLDRLQAVDISRPLVARLLGVAELRLEVAGGSSSEAPLQYLSHDDAIVLRAELLARAAGIDAATPEAPERVIHQVALGRLIGSTVLSGTFVFGVLMLVGLVGLGLGLVAESGREVAFGVASGMLPGFLAMGAAIWQQFGRNFDFTLSESPDGMRIRKGLLDTRHQTVPPGRVQGIRLRQPLLWRKPGWVRLDVDVAGYSGSSDGDGGQTSSTLLPVATYDEAVAVMSRIMPRAEPTTVPLDPAPRRAAWLRPIGWRRLAYGVDEHIVVVREGVLYRNLTVVPHAKTQSVRLTQGPIQRRLGLASAHVDTTPGPVDAVIRHRPASEARAFALAQADRARTARRVDVPERWLSGRWQDGPVTSTPMDSAVESAEPPSARAIADRYVETIADLNPIVGTSLGIRPGVDALPDLSPDGLAAVAEAQRAVLAELDAAEQAWSDAGAEVEPVERRAARLLRERLQSQLALDDAGDNLRELSNLFSPIHNLRGVFLMMPTASPDDWAVIGRRMARVPEALGQYRSRLEAGAAQQLFVAPRQVRTVVGQLDEWLVSDWYRTFVADGPADQASELESSAVAAGAGLAAMREFLADTYLPAAEGTPDAVGEERYARGARHWTGADLDLHEAYEYGWSEYHRLAAEMKAAADAITPGHTPLAVMRYLDDEGHAIEGVDEVRDWLQELMSEAMGALDGTHFDLAEPVKTVEAMIAPPGSAAAPYYTRPTLDFSRPGRTWLPTLGRTRFPTWELVSTWYHEGVPGHHLQLAQWVHVADTLSRYQVSLGSVSATTEGWALYAERLMDELGFLTDPARRLGYLDAQMMRAIRVIIDIGMHLRLPIPASSDFHPGQRWDPELGEQFFAAHSGRPAEFLSSEIVRYLGMPGQAISYKLGERAWLAGREKARAAAGDAFDLKAWHMAAISLGALGLDDLVDELAQLP